LIVKVTYLGINIMVKPTPIVQPAPQPPSKSDRFKSVGERRMSRVLKEFDLLENLASSNYHFTQDEVAHLLAALDARLESLRGKFEKAIARGAGMPKPKPVFTFD